MKNKLGQAWKDANGNMTEFYDAAVNIARENTDPSQRNELVNALTDLAGDKKTTKMSEEKFFTALVGQTMLKHISREGEVQGRDFLIHNEATNPLGQVLTSSLKGYFRSQGLVQISENSSNASRQSFFQDAFEELPTRT